MGIYGIGCRSLGRANVGDIGIGGRRGSFGVLIPVPVAVLGVASDPVVDVTEPEAEVLVV